MKKRKMTDHYQRHVKKAAHFLGTRSAVISASAAQQEIDTLKMVQLMEAAAKQVVARYGLRCALDAYGLYKALRDRNVAEKRFDFLIRDTAMDKYFSRYDQSGVLAFNITKKKKERSVEWSPEVKKKP